MTVKEILVQDLGRVLEETGNLMVDKMVLESLAKNGSVSLEEAEFYNTLVRRVVTEAAEEFVPDSLPIQEGIEDIIDGAEEAEAEDLGAVVAGAEDDGEIMVLTGEDGTVYNFNPGTCELTPVEGTGGADDESAALENPGIGAEVVEEPLPMAESTEVEGGTLVEEAEVELTESQQIVSNLIKSLGA